MIQSMTGYGKSELNLLNKQIIIELRTLNSKQLDIHIKTPSYFRDKELTLREILSNSLYRGKIELFITIENFKYDSSYNINTDLAEKYYKQLKEFQNKINNNENVLSTLFRMPNLIEKDQLLLDEAAWEEIKKSLLSAINKVKKYRQKEGRALSIDIINRIKNISNHLQDIKPFSKERTELKKSKLTKKLKEIDLIDENRLEQELIYYLEKQDITEEQVRLTTHLLCFQETINKESSQGKKLGFIAQEIGREINTIGAKASHAGIQKSVIGMKNELEKIKEQLMNIL
ncbi:MAG: YicC/YloC family endoribonuclease [Bacteroidota bacterium]|nr:YicC/YloC family endoribonuclease [Bacteroidota bacterium]